MSLPLPIAALARRAHNAKSAKERHDLAYFAWEASIRMAVAAHPPPDVAPLAVPSVGQWVNAFAPDERTHDDARLLAVYGMLTEVAFGKRSSPRAVTTRKLVEPLAAYRNQIIGHGAVRPPDFYESTAPILLQGLDAAWSEHVFFPAGASLVFVEAVDVAKGGGLRARLLDLTGLASVARAQDFPVDATHLLPGRVYLASGGEMRSLHPWLLYREAGLREHVLFFNGRAKSARYLDFVSGEELRRNELAEAFAGIDDDVHALFLQARPAEPEPTETDPHAFGDYRILGKLGEGGMGEVYLAVQQSLGRLVALKMLPEPAARDAVALARFQREIAALSRCEHPNVVKILTSGAVEGRHYYAMEFVDGADFADIARVLPTTHDFDAAISSAAERVRGMRTEAFSQVPALRATRPRPHAPRREDTLRPLLTAFVQAARAVQHLHDMGVVHRDLKPGNLMLTADQHRVVVMDLGLAALGDASRAITKDTSAVLGTLRYMPPEQIQRSTLNVDHRADVYSLGATFYELLAGRPLFDGDGEAQLIHQILHQAPLSPAKANPRLPRDIVTILEKCLQKEPRARYDSAEALARDVDAYLHGQPIVARPPTLGYVLRLAVQRHRGVAATVAGALATILAVLTLFVLRERALRREAEHERAEAEKQRLTARNLMGELLTEQGRQELVVNNDPARALAYLWAAYEQGYTSPALRFLLAEAVRPFDGVVRRLDTGGSAVTTMQFSPGGARLLTASEDGSVRIWNAAEGTLLSTIPGGRGPLRSAEFLPDGRGLLLVRAGGSPEYRDDLSRALPLAPDGSSLVESEIRSNHDVLLLLSDGSAIVWDTTQATSRRLIDPSGSVRRAHFADRGRIVAAGNDGAARLWDRETARVVATLDAKAGPLRDVAAGDIASPDAPRSAVATLGDDGTVHVWDAGAPAPRLLVAFSVLPSARNLRFELENAELATRVVVSGGGTQSWRLAQAKEKWSAELERTVSAEPAAAAPEADRQSEARRFEGPGGRAGIRTPEGEAEIVAATSTERRRTEIARSATQSMAMFSPCGRYILHDTGVIDARSGRVIRREPPSFRSIRGAFSADGERIVNSDGRVEETRTGKLLVTLLGAKQLDQVAYDRAGTRILGLDGSRQALVWNAATGEKLFTLGPHAGSVVDGAFAPSGETVITCGGRRAYLWDTRTGARIAMLTGHRAPVLRCAIAASGDFIATASGDTTAKLWDGRSGRLLRSLEGHADAVLAADFSPDGERLVTAGMDGTAKLWEVRTGELIASMDGGGGPLWITRWTADGNRLLTAAAGTPALRIWDGMHGRLLAILSGDRGPGHPASRSFTGFWSAELDGDGTQVLTSDLSTSTVQLWDVHTEMRPAELVGAIVARSARWRYSGGVLRSTAEQAKP